LRTGETAEASQGALNKENLNLPGRQTWGTAQWKQTSKIPHYCQAFASILIRPFCKTILLKLFCFRVKITEKVPNTDIALKPGFNAVCSWEEGNRGSGGGEVLEMSHPDLLIRKIAGQLLWRACF
jgi:hypothetical protein